MGFRALPTWHDGVKYRSRLEARWSVFFKAIGTKAVYEPQGFVTDGTAYLPDFLIFAASGPLWAEIKPEWGVDPDGEERWRKFAGQRPHPRLSRSVLMAGQPSIEGPFLVIGGDEDADNPVNGPWEDDTLHWRPCVGGYHFDLAFPGRFKSGFARDGCEDKFGGLGERQLEDAESAARSEKFSTRSSPDGTAA